MRRTVHRVAIADDHPLYRSAIAELLGRTIDFEVVCSADDLDQTVAFLEQNPCDLAIIDVQLQGTDGIAGARAIKARWPDIKIALISGDMHAGIVAEALRIGVTGFLPKSFNPDVILAATRLIMTGAIYIPHGLERPAEAPSSAGSNSSGNLTEREREVLTRMAHGRTYKEIARELELAEVTIKLHAQRIARKLGARNRAEAIARAVKDKLIEGPG
jgi:two-component system, NarL family, nitrate/nitrite response regulator NarL